MHKRQLPIWHRWSASRMQTLFTCLRRYAFQYVEKVETPHPLVRVVGSTLHFMFKRFFVVRYKSRESFASAARGFWKGVIEGEHGPDGYHASPITIVATEEQLDHFYGTITRICGVFFDNNAHLYNLPKDQWPRVEKDFTIVLAGMTFRGKVDRRHVHGGQHELWDYKASMTPVQMIQSIQLTAYTAYALQELGLPVDQLVIYNYFPGTTSVVPPRTDDEVAYLEELLTEAALIVETAIKGRPLAQNLRNRLRHFTEEEIAAAEQGIFLPILPECPISKDCEFAQPCAAWQSQNSAWRVHRSKRARTTSVQFQNAVLAAKGRAATVQLLLPLR